MSIYVTGFIFFRAGNFNLLKSPLRQIDITSTQVAPEGGVLQPEGGR